MRDTVELSERLYVAVVLTWLSLSRLCSNRSGQVQPRVRREGRRRHHSGRSDTCLLRRVGDIGGVVSEAVHATQEAISQAIRSLNSLETLKALPASRGAFGFVKLDEIERRSELSEPAPGGARAPKFSRVRLYHGRPALWRPPPRRPATT